MKYRHFCGDPYIYNSVEFPLLSHNEFILAGNISYDSDNLKNLNNSEVLILVKTKANQYLASFDANMKSLFIDNITSYSKEIGFENTVDLIMPIIEKIVLYFFIIFLVE